MQNSKVMNVISKTMFSSVSNLKQVHVATCGCSSQKKVEQEKKKTNGLKNPRILESNAGPLDWNASADQSNM